MKKFKILIIDDEGSIVSMNVGWRRVIDVLKKKGFIRSDQEIFYANGATNEFVENLQIHYSVMSSENQCKFEKIIENIDLWKMNYDIIFLDLNFESNFFEGFHSPKGPEIIFNNTSIGELKEGQIPNHLAGLYILNLLPRSKKTKKIIFSSDNRAHVFIDNARLLNNRFDDITILRYNDLGKCADEIDTFLSIRQLEVCCNLPFAKIQTILQCLEDEDYDTECIADVGDSWSLNTLFPRHINQLKAWQEQKNTSYYTNDNKLKSSGIPDLDQRSESMKSEIKNYITNYPKHLSDLSQASHPEKEWSTEKYIDNIRALKEKEFYKDNTKKSIPFYPITKFLEIETNLTDAEVRNKIIDIRRNITEFKAWTPNTYQHRPSKYDIRSWLKEYGFYPGYISYILSVIDNNSSNRNQFIKFNYEMKFNNKNNSFDPLVFSFDIREKLSGVPSAITYTDLNDMQINGNGARPDNCFAGQKSEGIEDIVKIICFRYGGKFEFFCYEGTLEFIASDQTIISKCSTTKKNTHFNPYSGTFKITIPLLPSSEIKKP